MTTDSLIPVLLRATLALNLGVAIVLLLRRPALRVLGARSTYLLWMLPLAMMLTAGLPMSTTALDILPVITVSARSAAAALILPAVNMQSSLSIALLTLWLLGALFVAAILCRQQQLFVQSLGELQRRAGGWHSQSDGAGPALVGALRPRIVLPADFDSRYDASERALILAHESVHLRRGDAQVNALLALLRCLNWFNPLIHFAASRFRFDQEVACDAVVISRFPESVRAYASAMLRTQLSGEARQELRLPVGCYWQSDHPLKERIMLLKKSVPARSRRIFATTCVIALIATGTLASWAAQPGATPAESAQIIHPIRVGEIVDAEPSEDITYRMMRPPKYPVEAVKALQSAKVVVKVYVDAAGIPQSAAIETLSLSSSRKSPVNVDQVAISEAFAKASTDAAMSWRFNSGLTNGKPTAGYALVPIDYAIDDDDECDGEICKPAQPARPNMR